MTVVFHTSTPDDGRAENSPSSACSRPQTERIEDADLHASSDSYASRFSGEVGQWMLAIQEDALLGLFDSDSQTVLDIGGGHGQTSLPLAQAHKTVTVLGSSHECGARLAPYTENGVISFNVGNLLSTPYQNSSFDSVVCFRLLSHSVAWRTLVAETCRVAHHSVILDYPVWLSFNFLSPLLFALKRKIEGNTRTYKLFSGFDVTAEFRRHGFVKERSVRQFFFPMALHRRIRNVRISQLLEHSVKCIGLTYLFGSPVITKYVRKQS